LWVVIQLWYGNRKCFWDNQKIRQPGPKINIQILRVFFCVFVFLCFLLFIFII